MEYILKVKRSLSQRELWNVAAKNHVQIKRFLTFNEYHEVGFDVMGQGNRRDRGLQFVKLIGAMEEQKERMAVTDVRKPQEHYTYEAEMVRVLDGDTIEAKIDCGFHVSISNVTLRLARIDAPEKTGVERMDGIKSHNFLYKMLEGKRLRVQTDKTGKYGRYIAEIWVVDESVVVNVNDRMLSAGHASPYTS
jgi:micrococcal nuclease